MWQAGWNCGDCCTVSCQYFLVYIQFFVSSVISIDDLCILVLYVGPTPCIWVCIRKWQLMMFIIYADVYHLCSTQISLFPAKVATAFCLNLSTMLLRCFRPGQTLSETLNTEMTDDNEGLLFVPISSKWMAPGTDDDRIFRVEI